MVLLLRLLLLWRGCGAAGGGAAAAVAPVYLAVETKGGILHDAVLEEFGRVAPPEADDDRDDDCKRGGRGARVREGESAV